MPVSQPRHEDDVDSQSDAFHQASQAQSEATQKTLEETTKAADAAASAGNRAIRASVDMMQRHADAVHQTLQSGAKLAARMTERSADQFGRAVGLSGDGAQKAAQRSTGNIEAIVHSSAALTQMTQRLSEEWVDFARARLESNFDRVDSLLQCRTPQDYAALQSELLRDHVESFLSFARRAGEHSVQFADEAKKQVRDTVDGRRVA